MLPTRRLAVLSAIWLIAAAPAAAAGNPMQLVGTLSPWPDGQYSNVAADAARHVAYLGSYDDQGVAVISTADPSSPVLTDTLSTKISGPDDTSDSADLDLVGRYLAVSHQPWSNPDAFGGISVYDTAADPHRCAAPSIAPVRTGALDPGRVWVSRTPTSIRMGRQGHDRKHPDGCDSGRRVSEVSSASLGASAGRSLRPRGTRPAPCRQRYGPGLRELLGQRTRIINVTDPANPVEVGAFD
jgi:hypothetical protein